MEIDVMREGDGLMERICQCIRTIVRKLANSSSKTKEEQRNDKHDEAGKYEWFSLSISTGFIFVTPVTNKWTHNHPRYRAAAYCFGIVSVCVCVYVRLCV